MPKFCSIHFVGLISDTLRNILKCVLFLYKKKTTTAKTSCCLAVLYLFTMIQIQFVWNSSNRVSFTKSYFNVLFVIFMRLRVFTANGFVGLNVWASSLYNWADNYFFFIKCWLLGLIQF